MTDDRLDEILRRLERLERHVHEGPASRPAPPPPAPTPAPAGPPAGFDEKRIVDLVVRLVTEHVERALDRKMREQGPAFDEKRLVDLVVGLVAERVDELVARRLAEQPRPEPGPER